MKTVANYPRRPNNHNTAALIRSLVVAAILLGIILAFTSCTLTVDPDGTQTWSLSGGEVTRAIIIYTK